eukprot:GDKJ01016872.1.p2 GENE.GDKJ01016872.1~~GDKJ01016872.1.p2  ORF type:complete len:129 (+),score=14.26 GDKJ01016872.1:66-452(+)
MFILGFFWKKTSSNAAMFATVGGFALSVLFKFLPRLMDLKFLASSGFSSLVVQSDGTSLYEIPFLDRMGFVFVIAVIGMVIISLIDDKRGTKAKGLEIDSSMFKVSNSFALGSAVVIVILTGLYAYFW